MWPGILNGHCCMGVVDDLFVFHDSLWLPTICDVPQAVERVEHKLAVRCPDLLREVFVRTSLRRGSLLHLHTLDQLELVDGLVVFANNAPRPFKYAVRASEAGRQDPDVYVVEGGAVKPEGCTLSEFLRLFWLINRPDERPYALLELGDEERVEWSDFEFNSLTLRIEAGAYLFTHRYVLQVDWDCVGARTDHALFMLLVRMNQLGSAEAFWTDAVTSQPGQG